MDKVFNREREKWVRPWNQEKFDNLYNRDERFFSIIIKGLLSWLNRNIVLYNKSINHFIFNTGSSYLYMESNGYEYKVAETTGEDTMYMKLPRCIVEISDINIPTEELSAPFSRGTYERISGNQLQGFNSEIRRLPIEITINMKYYLSNFNETIILLQELIDTLVFQRYFNVTYLGKVVQCSIEFPANYNPELNKIDMSSPEPTQRNLTLDIKLCTNYPLIDTRTEIPTDKVIYTFNQEVDLHLLGGYKADTIFKGNAISDNDGFDEFENNLISGQEDYIFDNIKSPIKSEETEDPNNPNGETNTEDPNNPNGETNTEDPVNPNGETNTEDPVNPNGETNTEDPNNPNGETNTEDPVNPNEETNTEDPVNPNDETNTEDPNNPNNQIEVQENEKDIILYVKDLNSSWLKKFDVDGDGIITFDDLLSRFDINGDGVIDENELINILEKIKYEAYDESYDYAESCHYKIDYNDIYYAIKLINKQPNVSAHYDRFTKKIYVTHNDTGEIIEIDLRKYKIV